MNESQAREARSFIIGHLRELRGEGALVSADVEAAAKTLRRNPRTIYRWINEDPRRPGRVGYEPSEEEFALYYALSGNVAAVYRDLDGRGQARVSLRTLRRAFRAHLDSSQRAAARGGEQARRRHIVRLKSPEPRRNDVFEADHVQLAIEVLPPRGARPVRPWLTSFLDAASRGIAGFSINFQQTEADVLAALRHAVLPDERIGPLHGIPLELRWDNGREFLAHGVSEVAANLGCLPRPHRAYAPHLKGRIERFHGTLESEFLLTLPYYANGARDVRGRLFGPRDGWLGFEELVERLVAWIAHYNTERPHEALGGKTPAQFWLEDAGPLRTRSEAELRWMALPSQTRRVTNKGIHFRRGHYVFPGIDAFKGEQVIVRYMPHDERWIDVYSGEQFVAQAKPSDRLSAEEHLEFLTARKASQARSSELRRKASRLQRARYAPNQGGASPAIVTTISREQARRERGAALGPAVDIDAGLRGLNQPYRKAGDGGDVLAAADQPPDEGEGSGE